MELTLATMLMQCLNDTIDNERPPRVERVSGPYINGRTVTFYVNLSDGRIYTIQVNGE